jgi:hypothetical protein
MPWSWTAGRLEDGERWHSAGGFSANNEWGVGYELAAGSDEFAESDQVQIEIDEGREGMPTGTRTRFGQFDVQFEPIAFSPVLLVHPDGREARFPRAMAKVTHADGRTGGGWIEWNQPPKP